jgi:hypothetical protein
MLITMKSPLSGKTHTMDLPVNQAQFDAYAAGALLQDAFPNLNADEAEFLKTGITAEEWLEAFGEEE